MRLEIDYQLLQKIIYSKQGELTPELILQSLGEAYNEEEDEYLPNDTTTENSCAVFHETGEVSVLGFINGILPELTGQVLVVEKDDETNEIVGWAIKNRWW